MHTERRTTVRTSRGDAVADVLVYIIAAVFIWLAYRKLETFTEFAVLTTKITFVPEWLRYYLPLLPAVEVIVALLMIIPTTRRWGVIVGALMLLAFIGYLLWSITYRPFDGCGCGSGQPKTSVEARAQKVTSIAWDLVLVVCSIIYLVIRWPHTPLDTDTTNPE